MVIFRTELEDALYVNWAVEPSLLPTPPAPLELETAVDGDRSFGFVTLVLFRQHALRTAALPWPRLSFAQCNLRLPVCDPDHVSSVWLLDQAAPFWAVPLGRVVAGQPLTAARFRASRNAEGDWRWELSARSRLEIRAAPSAPAVGSPRLGAWPRTVTFFRERPRAYVETSRGLSRIDAQIGGGAVQPMRIEVECAAWLAERLPEVGEGTWQTPHSAFLAPSTRLVVETAPETVRRIAARVPAPGVPA